MVAASWTWARAELRRGCAGLAVVAVLIALGAGAVMGGAAGARRSAAAIDRYLADAHAPAVRVYRQQPLDATLRSQLVGDARVAETIEYEVALAAPASLVPGLQGVTFVAGDDYWGGVTTPKLIAGHYPAGPDEIAMSELAARATGLAIGDVVAISSATTESTDRCAGGPCNAVPAGSATVVGVLRLPEDLVSSVSGEQIFLAGPAFVDVHGGSGIVVGHIADLVLRPNVDVDRFVDDYSTRITDGNVTSATTDLAGAYNAADLQHDALLIGTAVVAAAALLIVVQAFGRHLSRRSADASSLAALGMTFRQRTLAASIPGAVGAAAGSALSVVVAIAASPLFPLRTPRRADPDVGIHADLRVLVVGAAATAVVASAAAVAAAAMWARHAPASGPSTPVSPAARLAQRLHLSPAAAMGMRFALEPGRGNRRTPVVPALAGAVAALAVIVGSVVLGASLDGLLGSPARFGAPWTVQISGVSDADEAADAVAADARIESAALLLPGELDVSAVGGAPVQTTALGLQQLKGALDPVVLDGRLPAGPDEILAGADTLDVLGAGIGDRLIVSGPGGERTVTVAGRVIVPIAGGVSTSAGVIGDVGLMRRLGAERLIAPIDAEAIVLVRTHTADEAESLRAELARAGIGSDPPFRQSDVTALDEVRTVPNMVGVFTAAIGALAVFHALVVAGYRRRRDLAVMRALGCRPRQAGEVVCWQGFVFGLTSVALGIPIGLVLGRTVWRSVAASTDVVVVVDVPWPAIAAIATVAVVAAAAALAYGPATRASRRRPAADLRSE